MACTLCAAGTIGVVGVAGMLRVDFIGDPAGDTAVGVATAWPGATAGDAGVVGTFAAEPLAPSTAAEDVAGPDPAAGAATHI